MTYYKYLMMGSVTALLLSIIFPTHTVFFENTSSWMIEGTYVEYEFKNTYIRTTAGFIGNGSEALLRWQVEEYKSEIAVLGVSFYEVNFGSAYVQVMVDLENRELMKTEELGKTSLWIETNVSNEQIIVMSGKQPNTINGTVKGPYFVKTIQGMQASWYLVYAVVYRGVYEVFTALYDLDTGLLLEGLGSMVDVTLNIMGITSINAQVSLKNTNADLGQAPIYFTNYICIIYVVYTVACVLVTFLWVRKRFSQKRYPVRKNSLSSVSVGDV